MVRMCVREVVILSILSSLSSLNWKRSCVVFGGKLRWEFNDIGDQSGLFQRGNREGEFLQKALSGKKLHPPPASARSLWVGWRKMLLQ